MAAPVSMLLCGIFNAPKFYGKTPSKLPSYLEDIKLLGDTTNLDNTRKIKAACQYVVLNEAEVWQMLPEVITVPGDWDDLVNAVKKIYSRCKGINHYYHANI